MAQPPVRPPSAPPPQPAQSAQSTRLNIHGQPPVPNMAPDEPELGGLSDNTKAEMEAGKQMLGQRQKRDDAEHTAGRKHLESHAQRQKPPEDDDDDDV